MQNQVIPIKITPAASVWSLIVFLMFQSIVFAQGFPSEGIPLNLTKLVGASGTFNIPTHAAVPFQHNMLTAENVKRLVLVAEANPTIKIRVQTEISGTWADKSPQTVKWLKIFFTARIVNGVPQKYRLRLTNAPESQYIGAKLVRSIKGRLPNRPAPQNGYVLQPEESLVIDRGSFKAIINSDFSGFSLNNMANSKSIIIGDKVRSGPFLKSDGAYFYPDSNGTVMVETAGDNLVVVKATGSFTNQTSVDEDPYQYTCRLFFYAGSPLVKVQNAITFTKDMRESKITDHGYNLGVVTAINESRRITGYKDFGISHSEALNSNKSIYYTQESDAQYAIGRSLTVDKRLGKLSGRFKVQSQAANLDIFVSNFWQKYPNQLSCDSKKISIKTWSGNYRRNIFAMNKQLERANIYKFLSFHQGETLNFKIPKEYFENSLLMQEAPAETEPEDPKNADAIGSSIFQEFYVFYQIDAQNERLLPHLKNYPIALPTQKWIAESGVFGDVSEKVPNYDAIENTILDGQLSYSNPERGKNYGKFNFGDFNHLWNLDTNTPDLHRAWFNNHYLFGTALWQTLALRNDPTSDKLTQILNRARMLTEHYSSVDQCRFSKQTERIGAFWHGKAWVHWGGIRDTYGHSPDPGCLLYSWYLDDNRWAKDGFDLFAAAPNHYTSLAYNLINTSKYSRQLTADIYNGSLLHRFNPAFFPESTLNALVNLVLIPQLATMPSCANNDPFKALCDDNDPFFVPIWFNKYMEIDHEQSIIQNLKPYVLSNSKLDLLFTGSSIAFSAEAYKLSNDISHLKRHFYFLDWYSKSIYKNTGNAHLKTLTGFGAGPNALGDFHYPLQWPYFLKQLRTISNRIIDPKKESGYYPYRDGSYNIYILNQENVSPLKLEYEIDQPDNGTLKTTLDRREEILFDTPAGDYVNRIDPKFTSTLDETTLRRISKFKDSIFDTNKNKKLMVIYNSPTMPLFMPVNKENLPEGILISGSTSNSHMRYNSAFSKGYLTPLYPDQFCTFYFSKNSSCVSSVYIKNANNKVIVNRQLLIKGADDFSITLNSNDGPFYIELYGTYEEKLSNITFYVKMNNPTLQRTDIETFIFTRTKAEGTALKAYWDDNNNQIPR